MAEVIKSFNYTKTAGRGRGILGLTNYQPCRRPGERASQPVPLTTEGGPAPAGEKHLKQDGASASERVENRKASSRSSDEQSSKEDEQNGPSCLLIASHQYKADPSRPGGFDELSLEKGQLVEFIREHPDHEDWWEARNENGEVGFIPSAYVIVKKDIALPWLQWSALQSEEEERKKRAQRMAMKRAAAEGKGVPPPPLSSSNEPKPFKPYVSAYGRDQPGPGEGESPSENYYCEVCAKKFNGPVPYSVHMTSKAHKEEVALLEE